MSQRVLVTLVQSWDPRKTHLSSRPVTFSKVCWRTSSVSWRSCRMTKQTPLLNYLSDHLCELWVVNLKLKKQNFSRTMDVNQEITISWKNTLEKPRYKRTDNFWLWTKQGKLMRKEQWKKNIKPNPQCLSLMYTFGYLFYFQQAISTMSYNVQYIDDNIFLFAMRGTKCNFIPTFSQNSNL